ncbi:hypothetical protein Ppa06_26880 [Planomonospora parontospora subsp. parontospora]|uniref:Uncharacterized protein n=2 Tax=Planomonospora parontospora TaxID=58119 RepID=A0AA37F3U0_9ACTN|nr:hypothetical protein [Planomonospora parontospora]GGK59475.1 hypothetical protein GCM10010126_18800 [Planomonospora parontospora]GII08890.1 hypothetical protein Ppa06_26880 [Planomonospora parontospora subsp. parontospora]
MARTPEGQRGILPPAVPCVPVLLSAGAPAVREIRTTRFTTGARRVVRRVLAVGGLFAAGWLLAVVFGLLCAAPAAAGTTAEAEAAPAAVGSGPLDTAASGPASEVGDFPTESGDLPAEGNAEAMAGRGVDGLTSQSTPGFPAPSTVDHNAGANGFVPQPSGGSGSFGPSVGDIARFDYDPRLRAQRAPLAGVLPPVVRTAADDPSFSPD